MSKTVKKETLPMCDVCRYRDGQPDIPAAYDAKTFQGPWGNLCPSHFATETPMELGTGIGQMFLLPEDTYLRETERARACVYCLAPVLRPAHRRSFDILHDECCPRIFDVDGE